jgi:hypothetical protein
MKRKIKMNSKSTRWLDRNKFKSNLTLTRHNGASAQRGSIYLQRDIMAMQMKKKSWSSARTEAPFS